MCISSHTVRDVTNPLHVTDKKCLCCCCCCCYVTMPVQAHDALLFGPNNKHIPKLVQCFVEVLGRGTQLVDEPLGRRIANLLHSMRPSLPGDLVEGHYGSLAEKQKAAFSAYMAGQPLPQ